MMLDSLERREPFWLQVFRDLCLPSREDREKIKTAVLTLVTPPNFQHALLCHPFLLLKIKPAHLSIYSCQKVLITY